MSYNVAVEKRIDALIVAWPNLEKRKMFGGVCYLTGGNICLGIWKELLIVRAGAEAAAEKLREEHVRPLDVTGKPMKGWLMVAEEGWKTEPELRGWLALGREFALSLPDK
jgi:TfoX/Sxy family transcriptional regulator of competence genes